MPIRLISVTPVLTGRGGHAAVRNETNYQTFPARSDRGRRRGDVAAIMAAIFGPRANLVTNTVLLVLAEAGQFRGGSDLERASRSNTRRAPACHRPRAGRKLDSVFRSAILKP